MTSVKFSYFVNTDGGLVEKKQINLFCSTLALHYLSIT